MASYALAELCNKIDADFILAGITNNVYINKLSTPKEADEKSMVFISPTRHDKQEMFDTTLAQLIICDHSIQYALTTSKSLLIVENPKLIFAQIANTFFVERIQYGIHPTAVIDPEAKIAQDVHIGPYVSIGKCTIGANTIIHGNTFIYDNVIIHENVTINAGTILGANGCGQIKDKKNRYIPFPHIGCVIIEDNVEIGTNCSIAKGALGNTIIKRNTVIDSFVQIGHNVIVEENVLILANSVIGGSSIINKNVVIAIGAHICDYIKIGEDAHIGPGVVIMTDVEPRVKVIAKMPVTLKDNYK